MWMGKVPYDMSSDHQFEQFTHIAYGYRAACRLIATYISKYKIARVYDIINRWAPKEDGNNPIAYTQTVTQRTGLPGSQKISTNEQLMALVCGMAFVESKIEIDVVELKALFQRNAIPIAFLNDK